MRLATLQETKNLQSMFIESTRHANNVGHIDRPDQFDEDFFVPYIEANELHCFDVDGCIAGAVNLAEKDCPPIIWPTSDTRHLYIGKLATSDSVRGQQFFRRTMLPSIEAEARKRDKLGLRLSCLGDNPNLIHFYTETGFSIAGVASIFSSFYKKHVELTKFERVI